MLDVSSTTEAKSEQLTADDLLGGPRTIKVTKVSKPGGDQPLKVNYENENGKPFYPCKTVRRIAQHIWGKDATQWVGKSMLLFRDPEVMYAGQKTGGIRVSHMSHMEKSVTLSLTATSKSKKPFTVKPLSVDEKPTAAQKEPEQNQIVPPQTQPVNLEEDGNKYANLGVSSYKNWLAGLTATQKDNIKQHHAGWSKIAKEVDG